MKSQKTMSIGPLKQFDDSTGFYTKSFSAQSVLIKIHDAVPFGAFDRQSEWVNIWKICVFSGFWYDILKLIIDASSFSSLSQPNDSSHVVFVLHYLNIEIRTPLRCRSDFNFFMLSRHNSKQKINRFNA